MNINIDKDIAIKMDKEITSFLMEYGGMPALKEVDPRIIEAEQRLNDKLHRLYSGLESQFIQALRELGYLPSNPILQQRLIDEILSESFEDMQHVIAAEALAGAELGRQLALEDFLALGITISVGSFSTAIADQLLNKFYTFSEDTFSRISGDFKTTLSEAYRDGVGIDETVRRLRKDFAGLRDYRLAMIARTEIIGAQNEGNQITLEETGTTFKQWITANDQRVRGADPKDKFDHTALHGQVVRVDERFSNGLLFPGDRVGAIGEWIQCRCRQRPFIPRRGQFVMSTPHYP